MSIFKLFNRYKIQKHSELNDGSSLGNAVLIATQDPINGMFSESVFITNLYGELCKVSQIVSQAITRQHGKVYDVITTQISLSLFTQLLSGRIRSVFSWPVFVLILVGLVCFVLPSFAETLELPSVIQADLERHGYSADTIKTFESYHIVTEHSLRLQDLRPEGKLLLIYQDKRRIFKKVASDGDHFYRWLETLQLGQDVTGGGKPNAVLVSWTGGANCCYVLEIYELSEQPRLISTINEGHDEEPSGFYFPASGLPILATHDWVFSHVFSATPATPSQSVFLRFNGKRFALMTDYLHWDAKLGAPEVWRIDPTVACLEYCEPTNESTLPTPSAGLADWQRRRQALIAQLEKDFPQMLKDDAGYARANLAGVINPLVYGGNFKAAEMLVKQLWPTDLPGQRSFWQSYREVLKTSNYWSDLKKAYPEITQLGLPSRM